MLILPETPRVLLAGLLACVAPLAATTHAQICYPEEVTQLHDSDATESVYYGSAVATSGDAALVGRFPHSEAGTVYVYENVGGVWMEQTELLASDGEVNDKFGASLSIEGDTAVVGAWGDDNSIGAVYVFERTGGVWAEQDKLLASDGEPGDNFGFSVSLSGDTIVIGARFDHHAEDFAGSAYVFEKTNGVWTQQVKLLPEDIREDATFGSSVSIDIDTIVVGADGVNSAYIFEKTGSDWSQQAKLEPDTRSSGDWFGYSVAVSGETALVGAPLDESNGTDAGSVFVFEKTVGGWTQHSFFMASDTVAHDTFGHSISLSGEYALVGAPQNDTDGDNTGAVYTFKNVEGTWVQRDRLLASNLDEGDYLGDAVALRGNTAVIGARLSDSDGLNSGSAYIFDLKCTTDCPADVNNDGVLTSTDFTAWINAFNNALPECDQNNDGTCTPTDFAGWIINFNAGC